jgi:rhodanese-related sulfurtransferase
LNTVVQPLAGMSGTPYPRFASVDAIGSLLYATVLIGLGFCFSDQIQHAANVLIQIGGSALVLLIGLALLYIALKYLQRKRVLHQLRMARITAAELRRKLDAGEKPAIIDLRSKAELQTDPTIILGAIHIELDAIETNSDRIPRDRDVIVYCSCPNEVSSARVALLLRRKGITRIHPLQGGIAAWREENYPTENYILEVAPRTVTA